MTSRSITRDRSHALWALLLVATVGAFVFVTMARFAGAFESTVPVAVTSDRAGLVMEPGAKVKLRGIQVGRVASIQNDYDAVRLELSIDPDQIKFIPANVTAQIRATTVFGAKYVDLVYPPKPSAQRLAAGAVIASKNVSTEVNTVFQNLVSLLKQIDPDKLNGVLSALAQGLRGQGASIGTSITDANQVLLELNPRAETVRRDWQSLKGFADTYDAAAKNILTVIDAASTTSETVTRQAPALDALLLNVIGLSRSGIALFGPSKDNFVHAVNGLEPTTALLLKYNPEYTCVLQGAYTTLTKYPIDEVNAGKNGYAGMGSGGFQWGNDPYKYPDNLPITGARGGPGGKPGCGSLPDVSKNWPVRQLVTNTGWGTGLDWRPNPGIGFPGWANYFPVTRAIAQPPSIRRPGPPAPGPPPAYPGGPPYGAPWYAPDGTPLYPGLPPTPQPGSPVEPGPRPGSEPFTPPVPSGPQATCGVFNQACGPVPAAQPAPAPANADTGDGTQQ